MCRNAHFVVLVEVVLHLPPADSDRVRNLLIGKVLRPAARRPADLDLLDASDDLAWMRRQTHRDDPVGDLARDLAADPIGPAGDHLATVIDYVGTVAGSAASSVCLAASREWRTR